MAALLLSLIGAVCIHFTPITASGIRLQNTCSCLGQTVSFECVVTGGTLTVWSGTAFVCPDNDISIRHSNFVGREGSCNNGAIIGQGVTLNGNQYTSRLDVIMSEELVGRTIICSVDDGINLNQIGNTTLAINDKNTFSPPRISLRNIGPNEIIFNWDTVPHDGCPSFQYGISSMNCGTCIPTLTTSNMTTCTKFNLESYPNTSTCNFRANSIICGNISGSVSSPIYINLTVPGVPSVRSVPYYNYRTFILEEIQTSFNALESFRISENPVINGDADNYTVTYAETTTGATCYSDTIMASSCKDGICQHSYDSSSDSLFCRQNANITVTVFATNILGDGRMSTPINISGVNTFVRVTFNASTRTVLCNFSKTSPSDSHKQCIVNVTYGAECDQPIGTYPGTGTGSSNLITSPPFELVSGVSEYCISVNAASDKETVIVEERLNIFQTGELEVNNAGYVAGVVVPVVIVVMVMSILLTLLCICGIWRKYYRNRYSLSGDSAFYKQRIQQLDLEPLHSVDFVEKDSESLDFAPRDSTEDFRSENRYLVEGAKGDTMKLIGRVHTKGEDPENKQPFLEIKDLEGTLTINTENEHDNCLEIIRKITEGDLVGVRGRPAKKNGKLCMVLQTIELISPRFHQIADTQSSGTDDREKLDPMVDDGVAKKFVVRTEMISCIRSFLNTKGFKEVDTPMVNVGAGGAAAKRIVTGYTGLKQDVYTCLATEHYHKMFVLKGFDRVYEIGKHFNKEKSYHIDPDPEFTTCKFCCAFRDYTLLMSLTERMISEMVKTVTNNNNFKYHGLTVDFPNKFPRISVITELENQLETNFPPPTEKENFKKTLDTIFKEKSITYPEPRTAAKMLKKLIEEFIVLRCDTPTFIIDHPQILCPIAKEHRHHKGLTEYFELIICKKQICSGYTDLIDHKELRQLLVQQKQTGDYDSESCQVNERYRKVLEYGLPPCAEWTMEIDQMAMLLTDSDSLKEVMIFPEFKRNRINLKKRLSSLSDYV